MLNTLSADALPEVLSAGSGSVGGNGGTRQTFKMLRAEYLGELEAYCRFPRSKVVFSAGCQEGGRSSPGLLEGVGQADSCRSQGCRSLGSSRCATDSAGNDRVMA